MERGLGLCCEETVRLLLEAKGTATSPIAFVEREINDEPDDIPDDAQEARDAIFEERDYLFQILADRTRPFNKRLIEMMNFAVEASNIEFCEPNDESGEKNYDCTTDDNPKRISSTLLKSWIEILGKGESFGPAWDTAYQKLLLASKDTSIRASDSKVSSIELFTEKDGEKIIAYLLFRYYEKSLFDGNSLTKVEFALYFWIILKKFGNILAATGNAKSSQANPQTAKINAIKLLSKQTEYSEEIMELLETEFMENPAFSPANFKRILME